MELKRGQVTHAPPKVTVQHLFSLLLKSFQQAAAEAKEAQNTWWTRKGGCVVGRRRVIPTMHFSEH